MLDVLVTLLVLFVLLVIGAVFIALNSPLLGGIFILGIVWAFWNEK